MSVVPIDKALQRQYRDSLVVPSAPAFIDSDVPITPVAIVNPPNGAANVAIKQKGSLKSVDNVLEVTATGSKTINFTVPNGKKWQPKAVFFYADFSGTTNYWELNVLTDVSVGEIILDDGTDNIVAGNIKRNLNSYNFEMSQGQILQLKFTANAYVSVGDAHFFVLYQEWEEDQ